MDKGLWSFGTLFIGSGAHWVGTPQAIAISGMACARVGRVDIALSAKTGTRQPDGRKPKPPRRAVGARPLQALSNSYACPSPIQTRPRG